MNNKYDVVIGIEIHLELNTKTKMFSHAPNVFGGAPNTFVHQIDLGYPGVLPQVNKEAVRSALKLAKALEMQIDNLLRFDRKHYFYPDLPKGYQITQQNHPIGKDGVLEIETTKGKKKIFINRIHLEEDTAAQIHSGSYSYLNFNRAGIPLIEIVSEPCIETIEEAVEYVKDMRLICQYLNISDAKMEEGSFRTDINVSLKVSGTTDLGSKVEIKNLNSVANATKALEFEIALQSKTLDENQKVENVTKRFDEIKQQTTPLRDKTSVIDYRYIPEPNISPIKLSDELIASAKLPELPYERLNRYIKRGINDISAMKLVNNRELGDFFDAIDFSNSQKAANVIFSEIVSVMNSQNKSINELSITPQDISTLLQKSESNAISSKQLKELISKIIFEKNSLTKLLSENENLQIIDQSVLRDHIVGIIKTINDVVNEYATRPERIEKFIMGQLMKITKGKANPEMAMSLVRETLDKWK